jgi:hypothetical protein
MTALQDFTDFLKTVDLVGYRQRYSKIKIVEMDMPENVQAISLLYTVYWSERKFIGFEDFYKRYLKEHSTELEAFRLDTTLCKDDFYRGLEARIYRTWAGLITQIHAGYVAESVFGKDSVSMSAELDYQGADIRVEYKEHFVNYQIKKTSYSGVRSPRPLSSSKKLNGERIDINYEVPNSFYFDNPKTKGGNYRKPYLRFMNDTRFKRLDNGFVIFTADAFTHKKVEIDAKAR